MEGRHFEFIEEESPSVAERADYAPPLLVPLGNISELTGFDVSVIVP